MVVNLTPNNSYHIKQQVKPGANKIQAQNSGATAKPQLDNIAFGAVEKHTELPDNGYKPISKTIEGVFKPVYDLAKAAWNNPPAVIAVVGGGVLLLSSLPKAANNLIAIGLAAFGAKKIATNLPEIVKNHKDASSREIKSDDDTKFIDKMNEKCVKLGEGVFDLAISFLPAKEAVGEMYKSSKAIAQAKTANNAQKAYAFINQTASPEEILKVNVKTPQDIVNQMTTDFGNKLKGVKTITEGLKLSQARQDIQLFKESLKVGMPKDSAITQIEGYSSLVKSDMVKDSISAAVKSLKESEATALTAEQVAGLSKVTTAIQGDFSASNAAASIFGKVEEGLRGTANNIKEFIEKEVVQAVKTEGANTSDIAANLKELLQTANNADKAGNSAYTELLNKNINTIADLLENTKQVDQFGDSLNKFSEFGKTVDMLRKDPLKVKVVEGVRNFDLEKTLKAMGEFVEGLWKNKGTISDSADDLIRNGDDMVKLAARPLSKSEKVARNTIVATDKIGDDADSTPKKLGFLAGIANVFKPKETIVYVPVPQEQFDKMQPGQQQPTVDTEKLTQELQQAVKDAENTPIEPQQ